MEKVKVLFIENRGRTIFWAKVAADLERSGYEIHFLVQNPFFKPKGFENVHSIEIPNKKTIGNSRGQEPVELRDYLNSRDRGFRYFNSGCDHYGHYHNKIKEVLETISPDLVVGECTLFHELITIFLCKELSLKFVHPTGTRYPPGRFNIFKNDEQNVAIGSGESWKTEDLDSFILGVCSGSVRPAYMKKRTSLYEIIRFNLYRLYGLVIVTLSQFKGEKFNTPSLWRKMELSQILRKCKHNWEKVSSLPDSSKNILYLMQMQPEANLDVWGAPFSDQASLVKELASILPPDFNVIVKANPKAKYELFGFINELESYPNVYFAPSYFTMDDLKSKTYGILTVSGTIGLESVFSNGNCISLAHPVLSSRFPKYSASSIVNAVTKLLETECEISEHNEARDLLSVLISDSFSGVVGDPLYSHHAFDRENISKVASGIAKCI